MVVNPVALVANTPFSSYTASVTKLTGGLVNYVWRLADSSGKTAILKYADKQLSSYPEMAFSVERMKYEVRGLSLFNSAPSSTELDALSRLSADLVPTEGVHVPRLLHVDLSVPFVVLEDIGDHKGYEDWCATKPALADIEYVCGKIGEWIAHLHGFGHKHLDQLVPLMTNTPAREMLKDVLYSDTSSRWLKHTEYADKDKIAQLVMEFSQAVGRRVSGEVRPQDRVLLFGDMWSGSVMFDSETRQINIIDFEFATIGLIYGDVAHFVAHLLPVYALNNPDYDPNSSPCPPPVAAFLTSYGRVLKEKYPHIHKAVIDETVEQCTRFVGIEISRDVMMGSWCRCGSGQKPGTTPLTCACLGVWLEFSRKYILGTNDSVFNLLR
ncbi:hypothetical protein FBU59_003779 [Linderina macrospora]|uniref:Uncharacterized protein n=1 Tax=Linderina macrospora TaxID=4868 RepID=A0ACC1J7B1_9FUNG|nr:hypothetical protein FBU59_003779 [Linderina macrospora]